MGPETRSGAERLGVLLRTDAAAAGLFVVLLGAATYLGHWYDTEQSKRLAGELQRRADAVLATFNELTIAAKTEAQLLAAADLADRELKSSIPDAVPVSSSLLQREGDHLTVLQLIHSVRGGRNAVGKEHPLTPNFNEQELGPYYYPSPDASHISYCAAGKPGRFACAAVALSTLVERAERLTNSALELELRRLDGSQLLRTSHWQDASDRYGVVTTSSATSPVQLAAKPTDGLIRDLNIGLGLTSSFIAYVIIVLAFLPYLLNAHHGRQRARLSRVIESQQSIQSNLLLSSISTVAAAASIRFFLARPDGTVELFGPWDDESGLQPGTVTGKEFFAYATESVEHAGRLADAVSRQDAWSTVVTQLLDGEQSDHQMSAAPVSIQSGYLGLLGVAANVTTAIKAENAEKQLVATREAQANYLRYMSHELKGHILRAQSALGLLGNSVKDCEVEQSNRWLQVVERSLTVLSDVVKNVVELMRLRQDEREGRLSSTDMFVVARLVVSSLQSMATSRSQQVVVVVDGGNGLAFTHQESVLKLLQPLLTNALQYSPEGSKVHVSIATIDKRCILRIEDEGPGMPRDEIVRLGTPFFRGRSAVNAGSKGNGLGISLAHEYARMAGAKVDFEMSSKPGRGLMATVQLSAATDDAPVALQENG